MMQVRDEKISKISDLSFTQQLKTHAHMCVCEREEGEMEQEFICLKAISITTKDSRPQFHF